MAETQGKLSLATINDGVAIELFDYELQRVLENIKDPNTSDKTREVNLKMIVRPSKDRTIGEVEIYCVSKLASLVPAEVRITIDKSLSGKVTAAEMNTNRTLPFPEGSNVTAIGAAQKEV